MIRFGLVLFLGACTEGTRCDPSPVEPTGDLAVDLVATWADFGTDSPVYYDLRSDGSWHTVESPNSYAPKGLQSLGRWSVDGSELTLSAQGTDTVLQVVAVEADSLTLAGEGYTDVHRRVTCEGYGFDG